MVVHDPQQSPRRQIPHQNETGYVTSEHLTPAAVCNWKCRLRGIESDRRNVMAGHRTGYDVHPEPALLSFDFLRNGEAAPRQDLCALLTEIAKRLFGQAGLKSNGHGLPPVDRRHSLPLDISGMLGATR